MLIDATHPEETRVVVTRGNRVEEFDYESATRKQLRGNIYLAKVARIEPSLQAAFVNYGGNRHGFLAFAEIHPDYYQIPVAVREALMKEEAQERKARAEGNDTGNTDEAESQPAADSVEAGSDSPASDRDHADSAQERPLDTTPATAAGESDAALGLQDEGERGFSQAPIALEAALPPAVYEEFAEAIARAEEARDEIPSYPGDVETTASAKPTENEAGHDAAADQATEANANGIAGAQPPFPRQVSEDGEEEAASRVSNEQTDTQPNWESSPEDTGGVISVPEPQAPAPVEMVGSEDALEELPQRHKRRWRHYKIQEVIKRNQIVLIQVVKEERGTKGAALTTYLSLAGRYTVLMPNTPSGGGISRKITVPADRKRLKEIAQELDVPEGMGLIIRTAGASRTKAEIKRDFEYLLRLWENVRDLTLKSTAPCLVYEEGNLIKRSIRDLYNKDIDEIIVAGDEAHREAKDFMRMLMPSHAKNVILYKDPEPVFTKYEVERQLNQMFSPVVTLRSGGYIVLNQTEALVAIDVNSGRATREYSIEDTALKTNLEASEEVARQVRLRDLAGLIVIDFIDMDERRNNRAVERRLKEALRHDRARIQVGHISHFGLLEMSRQRLRQGVVEVSTMPCPVCQGVGHIRSTESVALMILRSIEDNLRTQGAADITATAATESALYILNHKRAYLRDIEIRYGVSIVIQMDENAHGGHFALTRGATASAPVLAESKAIQMEPVEVPEEEDEATADGDDKRSPRRKRRRRRGRSEQPNEPFLQNGAAAPAEFELDDADKEADEHHSGDVGDEKPAAPEGVSAGNGGESEQESQFRRNRRRGRRGGRRHREDFEGSGESPTNEPGNIPGLGEQPVISFDVRFPKNLELGPLTKSPVEQGHEHVQPKAEPAAENLTPERAGNTLAAESEPDQRHEVRTHPVELKEISPPAEPTPLVERAAPAAPVKEPRPKPVRTGPARKGWWQRKSG